MTQFKEGDRVVLDSKVPGVVDGFYGPYVVFRSDYKIGKVLYGRMPMASTDEPDSVTIADRDKIFTLSSIIVHPSNLRREQ